MAQGEKIELTKEQKLMLEMSQLDIQEGWVIAQNDLDKNDLEWLIQSNPPRAWNK